MAQCWCESSSLSAAQHPQQSSVSAYTGSVTLNEFSHSAYVHSEAFWRSLGPTIKSCHECQCHSFNLENLVLVLQIKGTQGSPFTYRTGAHTFIITTIPLSAVVRFYRQTEQFNLMQVEEDPKCFDTLLIWQSQKITIHFSLLNIHER